MKAPRKTLWAGGTLVVLLVPGLLLAGVLSLGNQYTAVTILLYAVIAQAWNVVAGYGGQLSLGVAAFTGVGGYAAGLLMLHQGMGWIEAVLAATALCALLALVLGLPLLRLRGVYFAVGTLAASVALQAAAQLWTWVGGGSGFTVPIAHLPSSVMLLRAAVVAFAIAMAAVLFVRDSPFGLRVVAARDDEQAAAGLGISNLWHRMAAFVIGGALTGLAGALVALQTITVNPAGMFDINWTINATLFVVAGGIATVIGPLVGVVLVYVLLTQGLENLQAVSGIIEGVILVVILRFAPEGLWPLILRGANGIWRRRRQAGSGDSSSQSRRTPEAEPAAINRQQTQP